MTTGERMKMRRKELGLSAEYVADKLGCSAATIYRYEKGDIENLPLDILDPIAEALETTPSYLMGWEEEHTFSEGFIEKLSKYPPEEVERAMEIIDLYEKASPEGRAAFETLLKLSQQKP